MKRGELAEWKEEIRENFGSVLVPIYKHQQLTTMFLRVKACLHGLQKSGAMSRSIQGKIQVGFTR